MADSNSTLEVSEEQVILTDLEPTSNTQLGHGSSKPVSTTKLRKCTISTSIRDVRTGYFVDGEDPSLKHTGAVVILSFEFGSQKRDSWKPWEGISNIRIQLSVEEVDEDDFSGKGGEELEFADPELQILAVYPRNARGSTSETMITRSASASLYSPPGAVTATGGLSYSQQFTLANAITVRSAPNGTMSTVYTLEENKTTRDGIPDVFSCAILVQTDGLPWELEVQFVAPVMGIKYGGKQAVSIGSRFLKERKARAEWERELQWEDFDSENFKRWVERKTTNGWVEKSDYSARGD